MFEQTKAGNKRRIHNEGQHPEHAEGFGTALHDKINSKQAAQIERQHPHAKGMVQHIAHGSTHHWPSSNECSSK